MAMAIGLRNGGKPIAALGEGLIRADGYDDVGLGVR